MSEEHIGYESFEVKREDKTANIGPGPIKYGHGQRMANYRGAGGNLPFTQKIEDNSVPGELEIR